MPDHLGEDMRKIKKDETEQEKDIKGKYFQIKNNYTHVLILCDNYYFFVFKQLSMKEI